MRSLSVMLCVALALPALTACDKKADEKADKKEGEGEKKEGEKADAKKTDEQVSANAEANPEEGCIHGEKHEAHQDGEGEGCNHGGAAPTESTGHFGAPFALADATPLSTVLASGELPTEAVKVTGTVESVCQKMGCWMVIKEGDVMARVLIEDHAFAIPMDGKGKTATVEGKLESKELTEANVAHLKKDGDDQLEGEGPRKEYFLHATAVELLPNS